MATIRDRLKTMFTKNVLIKHLPGGRLKAYDVSKSQSVGSPTKYSNRSKWRSGRMGGYGPGFGGSTSNEEIESLRKMFYIDYELMDSDAIISSALDLIAEESTTVDVDGQLLKIRTDNEKIKKILHNLFYDVLNIEFNLWSWIRTMCKYGDHFLYLQIDEEFGITNVMPIHPSLIRREEGLDKENPDIVQFVYDGDGGYWTTQEKFEAFEIAHFRLLTDTNYLPYGRCLPKDSYIDMEFGVKTIDNVVVGDKVWTYNINTDKLELSYVVNKVSSGVKNLIEICTQNNSIKCSQEHPILCFDKGSESLKYKPANKIVVGDLLVLNSNKNTLSRDVFIDKNLVDGVNKNECKNNIDNVPDIVNTEFVRLFGFLLGGGRLTMDRVAFACGVYPEINNYYKNLIEKFSGKTAYFSKSKHNGLPNACIVSSKMLTTVLSNMELKGGAKTKRVPSWVFELSPELKESFIRGFIDADGSTNVDKYGVKRYKIELVNRELCQDLKILASTINIKTSNIKHRHRLSRKSREKFLPESDCYYFYIYLEGSKIRQEKKYSRVTSDNIILKPVKSIKQLESQETFDIQVESDNSNFIANGIIVHNSFIEPAKKSYKMLSLLEDAVLLHRIMRAPERRIVKIDIGNIAPEEVDAHVEQIVSEMKKTPYIDPQTGEYNLRYNLENAIEDWFLPVRGGQSGNSVETLPGLQNQNAMDDVEYVRKKMMAALKIPKEFLGYGEDSGGSSKAGLASLDVRFARTVERVQKIFVSELYKIAIIHLYTQGFREDDLLGFEIYLTNPSLVFERQKTDVMTAKVDLAKSIKEDNVFSQKYIYENIFGMSEDEWKADIDRRIEDAKLTFRLKQITEEGNDPQVSGKSFGTPWDIASLQVSSRMFPVSQEDIEKLYTPDGREENEGKPPQYKGNFETKRDQDFGRDPVGRRENDKIEMPSVAKESYEKLIKRLEKRYNKDNKKSLLEIDKNIDSVNMLNEDNILDDFPN
jgi:intein/homing endonuclease